MYQMRSVKDTVDMADVCKNVIKIIITRKPSPEVAPTTLATFSSCHHELMTLAIKLDTDNVKVNRHAKYLCQCTV